MPTATEPPLSHTYADGMAPSATGAEEAPAASATDATPDTRTMKNRLRNDLYMVLLLFEALGIARISGVSYPRALSEEGCIAGHYVADRSAESLAPTCRHLAKNAVAAMTAPFGDQSRADFASNFS